MTATELNALIQISNQTLLLKGRIVIETVANYKLHLAQLSEITHIDLQGVTQLDSSLLALLVEYRKLKPDLKIIHPPDSLSQLMNAYQFAEFII